MQFSIGFGIRDAAPKACESSEETTTEERSGIASEGSSVCLRKGKRGGYGSECLISACVNGSMSTPS